MTALTVLSDPTSQQGAPTEAEQPSLELEKHTRPLAPGEPKPSAWAQATAEHLGVLWGAPAPIVPVCVISFPVSMYHRPAKG
jgi:hypothetical protein